MRMNRIIALAACLLASFLSARGQMLDKKHLSIGAGGRYSYILDGHDIHSNMLDSKGYGIFNATLGFSTRPEDGGWYERAFNYPTFGIGLSYARLGMLDFKGTSRLGDFVNLYGWTEFSLVRTRRFRAGPLLELGLAFTDKTYDYYENPKNMYVGSKVLFVLGLGLQAEWLVAPQWSLQFGAYLTHHSNGMMRSPNLGINELSVGVGVRHYLSDETFNAKPSEAPDKPAYPKGLRWNVFAAGGVHSCPVELDGIPASDSPDRLAPARFQGTLGVESVWRYAPVFATGLGVEANYVANNYRQTDLLLTGSEDPDGYSPIRVAAFVKQEFWYRRLSVHVAFGVYLFKRCGLTEDVKRTYEKIGVRYHFGKSGGLFAGLDLRAHQFDRSYALEWSLGYGF